MSYAGKISTIGNSDATKLDKDLFKQHHKFKKKAQVRADVIGPGTKLIQVVNDADNENDQCVIFAKGLKKGLLPTDLAQLSKQGTEVEPPFAETEKANENNEEEA